MMTTNRMIVNSAHVPAPSAGDIWHVGRAHGWPARSLGGVHLPAGAEGWRRVLETLSPDVLRRVWESLGELRTSRGADDETRSVHPAARVETTPHRSAPWNSDTGLTPRSHEFGAVIRAYQAALRNGLRVPASAFVLRWYDRDEPDTVLGFMMFSTERPVPVWIARGQSELETFRTFAHEIWHVEDAISGRFAAMDKAEQERRADGFMWRCVADEYGVL